MLANVNRISPTFSVPLAAAKEVIHQDCLYILDLGKNTKYK